MTDNPLATALTRTLRPLARLAVAHGVKFRDMSERLKDAFLFAAEHDAPLAGKMTDSRISVLTGLQRKDIKALRERRGVVPAQGMGPLPRLILTWRSEQAFTNLDGSPAILARSGDAASFDALAAQVSTDVHPRTLLDEMVRLGLARTTVDGVELLTDAFVPGQDSAAALTYLGGNLGDHADAAVSNVLSDDTPPNFERAAHFNRLTPPALDELDALARQLQQEALEKIAARAAALQRAGKDDPAATGRFRCGAYVLCVENEEAET